MIKNLQFLFFLGSLCVLTFSSCSKKETMEVDNETQSVVDYAIADQEFMAMLPSVFQSALITKGLGTQTNSTVVSCDTLSFVSGDTTDFIPNPVYVQNVYNGACPSVMGDGKIRSGKILVRFTGKIGTLGSQMIFKLNNYMASGLSYACDSIVLTTKESNGSFTTFNAKLVNGTCKTSTISIKYNFDRTIITYPKGESIGGDAVTYIYGNASGTNRQGTNFSTSVLQTTALVKYKTCPYIVRGMMELTPEGFKTRTINFGEGNCDDEATFTVKENTVAFKLK